MRIYTQSHCLLHGTGHAWFLRIANRLPKHKDQPSVEQTSIRDEQPDMQNKKNKTVYKMKDRQRSIDPVFFKSMSSF